MKNALMTAILGLLLIPLGMASTSDGPTLPITTWNATYLIGDATIPKTSVTVALPATIASRPVTAVAASTPQGWLAVYQATGTAKLSYNLQINPSTLVPGNY